MKYSTTTIYALLALISFSGIGSHNALVSASDWSLTVDDDHCPRPSHTLLGIDENYYYDSQYSGTTKIVTSAIGVAANVAKLAMSSSPLGTVIGLIGSTVSLISASTASDPTQEAVQALVDYIDGQMSIKDISVYRSFLQPVRRNEFVSVFRTLESKNLQGHQQHGSPGNGPNRFGSGTAAVSLDVW